jgi:hypothetical protein
VFENAVSLYKISRSLCRNSEHPRNRKLISARAKARHHRLSRNRTCQTSELNAVKIRHHFIGEQFDPVPRPPRVACAGVEIEGNLVDAELVA